MTENVNVLRHKANSAIEAAVLSVEAMAAEKERAKIVAWLRKTANMNPQSPEAKAFVLLLCNTIEAGEYLK